MNKRDNNPIGIWMMHNPTKDSGKHWSIFGLDCEITLEERPGHCDRGNFIAKIFNGPSVHIDDQDCWPRYYFDFDVAQSEVLAWLEKRKQLN